jgi:hypothetical protein
VRCRSTEYFHRLQLLAGIIRLFKFDLRITDR